MISQYAKLVEKLTRGFIKFTGRQPDNLEKLKIRQEAANRIKEESKVVEFPKEKITPFYKERPMPKESKSEGVESLFKPKEQSKIIGKMIAREIDKPGMKDLSKYQKQFFKEKLEKETGMKLTGKETFGELMEKLGKGKKEGIEQIDIDDIDDFDPSGMAAGGRVGLQTGGFMYPAEPFPYYNLEDLQIFTRAGIPESEAKEIYKRAGYVFDPTKRSLGITSLSPTTTSTSTTPAVTTPNVVAPTTVVPTAQTIQTGGGDDRGTGFGRFGNLDPTTEKTFNVEVYDEEVGDFVPTTLTGYQNVNSGLYQTKEGKNINPMFSNTGMTPGIIGAAVNLLGLDQDTVGGYVPGSIRGKYDGIGDLFTQTKEFLSRKENLKQDAFQKAEAERAAQEKIKKAEEAKKIAEAAEKIRIKREKYGTTDYGQGAGGQSYSNMGTQGFGVAGGGYGGPVSNRTGRGRQDYEKGGKVKKSKTDRIIDFLGGKDVVAAELGLLGVEQLYNLLGLPFYAKGGLAKNNLTDTIPPEKGPDSKGVESLFRRK